MKATKLLKEQHREVEDLFKQVQDTDDADERRELLDLIKEKLEMHMAAEEQVFYPAVRQIKMKKVEELIPEAYEEHHVVKLVLTELPQVDPEDEQFKAKMTVLEELIEHHVKEEEKEMFKIAEKLGEQRLTELAEQMQDLADGGEADVDAREQDEQHME